MTGNECLCKGKPGIYLTMLSTGLSKTNASREAKTCQQPWNLGGKGTLQCPGERSDPRLQNAYTIQGRYRIQGMMSYKQQPDTLERWALQ